MTASDLRATVQQLPVKLLTISFYNGTEIWDVSDSREFVGMLRYRQKTTQYFMYFRRKSATNPVYVFVFALRHDCTANKTTAH